MSEWWTYRLHDFLMFSRETYYRLFERYNQSLWPWQPALVALGAGLVWLVSRGDRDSRLRSAAALAACWVMIAWFFHWHRLREIHLAAGWLAGAFVLEGVLLLGWSLLRSHRTQGDGRPDRIGVAIVVFGVFLQPLIGPLLGRPWPSIEWFGAAPDPTVTATLGFLVAVRAGWLLWGIPALYAVISGATLWTMHAPEAWVPPLVVLLCIGRVALSRNGRTATEPLV